MDDKKPCPFRCGNDVKTWNWIGVDRETKKAATREITVYTCPTCEVFGITGRVEICFGSPDKWDQGIERDFHKMRAGLIERRKKEVPKGSSLIGVFSLMNKDAGLELVFLSPHDHTT